ncbi:tetratricopeptide repeat protein [Bacillus carboniphilus]|uniref:Tetratricopeptide repeat protein n=1 Tax=Bacillus carboniphilus TaxID=86663 RepID=A0ABY9JUV2_9BACI|nr:tetratricopeptide repeat protein [Bacillus carboniphilus]WLR41435.1 tetratricopeptide repeat protein [Bacillus carboniphilus]
MGKQYTEKKSNAQVVSFFQDEQYYYKRGMKAYHEGDLDRAARFLRRANQVNPSDADVIIQLANIYTELGDYDQSNSLLIDVMDQNDIEINDCYYFLANNYAYLGFFHEAFKWAKKYQLLGPTEAYAEENQELLELLTLEGADKEEMKEEDELLIQQEAAKSMLERGKFLEAIDVLEKMIEKHPSFWSAYNNLSLAYFYMGEVEKAKEILMNLLQLNKGNLHALCNLTVYHYYEKDEKEVEDSVQQLIRIYPLLIEHRYKLGATFALIGSYTPAFKWLYSLYKQGFAGDATFYYWLACSAYYTGNEQFAKRIWERVVEDNPLKKGSEPWAQDGELQWIHSAERLYDLYVCKQFNKPYENKHSMNNPIEKEAVQYLFYEKTEYQFVKTMFFVADQLCEKHQSLDHHTDILKDWFVASVQLHDRDIELPNSKGLAAAFDFLWYKAQDKQKTKKSLAIQYDLSPQTVSKYVKWLGILQP